MDLNLLSAFEALDRERHVTRAAKRLGIGQPAMSAALARLRKAFGDELFLRAGDGMRPTPKASRVAPVIRRALEDLRRAVDAETPFEPSEARRSFTIASSDYTSLVLTPGLAARLRADAPAIELRVVGYDKSSLPGMLSRGEVDVAIGVFPDPPEGCVRTPLFTERFVGLARADHPALAAGPPNLERFLEWPHALVTLKRDAKGAVDEALRAIGRSRRIALTTPHMLSLPAVLMATDLIAAIPSRVAPLLAATLTAFAPPIALDPWEVAMLWSPEARSDAATGWLRRRVVEAAREV